MVSVTLGAKNKNHDFDVTSLSLDGVIGNNSDYAIGKTGDITISTGKSDYVTLSGDFVWSKLMTGNYAAGVKSLDGMTVVQDGVQVYSASGLNIDGSDVASSEILEQYLSGQKFGIKGNIYANDITGGDMGDTIHGLGGNDSVYGGEGNDRLFGETGNDNLVGGAGNDLLYGGSGADVFEFSNGDGDDVILDFLVRGKAQDHIDLSDYSGISSFADLDISQVGKSTLITIGDDSILLKNVSEKFIDASDFNF